MQAVFDLIKTFYDSFVFMFGETITLLGIFVFFGIPIISIIWRIAKNIRIKKKIKKLASSALEISPKEFFKI